MPELTTVKNLARESNGVFSEAAIRNLLCKHSRILSGCIVKAGTRTLIDVPKFYAALPTLPRRNEPTRKAA
ncbi:MAG TPA: hypothetical protein P5102_02895 [Candidatus Competibacteraceae bacterium]|nr:hypothetical protein [Candidatus Competibacteraceae bacterium]HRZ05093.1 hypothetical protein [Candidatus Competibacteraceae bacterium]HSA47561.1 hypothetical protein [Candidatus Competibacteraceae bacterium]